MEDAPGPLRDTPPAATPTPTTLQVATFACRLRGDVQGIDGGCLPRSVARLKDFDEKDLIGFHTHTHANNMDISTLAPLPVRMSPYAYDAKGAGLAVCQELAVLVISFCNRLQVFALPEDIARGGVWPGTGTSARAHLGRCRAHGVSVSEVPLLGLHGFYERWCNLFPPPPFVGC